MALIKCPDCGKDVSDKAQSCIHCGCPILKTSNKVRVKMPMLATTAFIKNKEYGLMRQSDGSILWRGRIGAIAEFELNEPTDVSIKFLWGLQGHNKIGRIHPGKTYQIKLDTVWGYNLIDVDVIDSD